MQALRRAGRDPYWDDGKGVRRARTKRRVIGGMAFLLAVAACGLTTAMWILQLAPAAERLLP